MASGECSSGAFRILVVSPRQWTRALLIAELDEAGYDAIGAASVLTALRYRGESPERGPVKLVLLEDRALDAEGRALLGDLRQRHPAAKWVILTAAGSAAPTGQWDLVIQRPIAIRELVQLVRKLLGPAPSETSP